MSGTQARVKWHQVTQSTVSKLLILQSTHKKEVYSGFFFSKTDRLMFIKIVWLDAHPLTSTKKQKHFLFLLKVDHLNYKQLFICTYNDFFHCSPWLWEHPKPISLVTYLMTSCSLLISASLCWRLKVCSIFSISYILSLLWEFCISANVSLTSAWVSDMTITHSIKKTA